MVTECLSNSSMFYLYWLKTIWLPPSIITMSSYFSSSPKSPHSLWGPWFESAYSKSGMVEEDSCGRWASTTRCWRRLTQSELSREGNHQGQLQSFPLSCWKPFFFCVEGGIGCWPLTQTTSESCCLFSSQFIIQQQNNEVEHNGLYMPCEAAEDPLFHSYRICSTFNGLPTWAGKDGEERERKHQAWLSSLLVRILEQKS